jgi:LysM repeat protein
MTPADAWEAAMTPLTPTALHTDGDENPVPARTRMRLASGAGVSIALAVASVAASATTASADETYTVRPGDTVSHIAQRTSTTVAAIARANALADASRIRMGQVLTIPQSTGSAARAVAAAPAAQVRSYSVVSGDTVSAIATRLGTTVAAIRSANGLDTRAFIRIGQVLTIPTAGGNAAPSAAPAPAASTPATTTVSSTTSYVVASGDNITTIAVRLGSTVAAIRSANGLDARGFIRIGQVLTVPTKVTVTTALVGSTFAGRTYSVAVVAAANANKATLLKTGVPSRAQMKAKVAGAARAMGVDPSLALAVAYQESGFDQTSVSPANAIGTMQVIPSSGDWASQIVGRRLNLLNPDDNALAGVAILRSLVRSSPDLATAIAGYYQGAASVQRDGMFADTRRYVASVQTLMSRFA